MKMYPKLLLSLALLWGADWQPMAAQTPRELVVEAATPVAQIQPTMYGIFFEDINFAADGGLYAEMVKNRGFEFEDPMMGWQQSNSDRHSLNLRSGRGTIMKVNASAGNKNSCRVVVNEAANYALTNEGFRGMGVKAGANYRLSVRMAVPAPGINRVRFQLVDAAGKVLAQAAVSPSGKDWQGYEATLTATQTEAKAQLKITFEGKGTVDMDMVSLFPEDTWMGRKNGMRKDIVQLLYDMKPGFLRFPGGCIVEGRTLAQRYQWKKTVGAVEDRELLINRWNTEFAHRPAPDYFQSFGLGFFEYFQLAEDLGAAPMPILSCGMACQFNTAELVPMEDLGPYIQDALDLIAFANADATDPWGKLRTEMGHPAPFNLKYLGIGNEQWGQDYIDRFVVFEKAIKAAHPDIVIISGSGPFPDGEHFEFGMETLVGLNAEIVDEHYYRPPNWFRENATRYDSYDRSGPKIFAGEYAAQSVAIASPDNKNNWNCALSEAAFMTGLERNADVVVMTSYAPLMAHVDGWQWTPDMLWFDNLRAYGTANYYVQKMYATNRGTDLVRITQAGQPLTGQGNLYATAALDAEQQDIIVKVVNTGTEPHAVSVAFKGKKVTPTASVLTLTADGPEAVNSLDMPMKISPVASTTGLTKGKLQATVPAQSFVVYRVKLR